MTLQDLVDLTVAKSPLMCGGPVTGQDVCNFLWSLSLEWDETTDGKKAFMLGLPEPEECYSEALEYLAFIFIDAPKSGDGSKVAVSSVACALDFLMTEYRWAKSECLACSLPQVFQFQRAASLRKGGKPTAQAVNLANAAYLQAINKVFPVEHRERWINDQLRELEKEAKRVRVRH